MLGFLYNFSIFKYIIMKYILPNKNNKIYTKICVSACNLRGRLDKLPKIGAIRNEYVC